MIIFIKKQFLSIGVLQKYKEQYAPSGWTILPKTFGGNMVHPSGAKRSTDIKC